jgi:hypothetical protein
MEFRFTKNPQIMNFLNQYDKREWDFIIEDLLLYSINKVNTIEEEEKHKKIEIKSPPKKVINKSSEIITFKNCRYTPYECAKNKLIENAEYRLKKSNEDKKMKKLNELDKELDAIKIKKKY